MLLEAVVKLEEAQLRVLNEKAILLLLSSSSGVTMVDCKKVLTALLELENNYIRKSHG